MNPEADMSEHLKIDQRGKAQDFLKNKVNKGRQFKYHSNDKLYLYYAKGGNTCYQDCLLFPQCFQKFPWCGKERQNKMTGEIRYNDPLTRRKVTKRKRKEKRLELGSHAFILFAVAQGPLFTEHVSTFYHTITIFKCSEVEAF